MSRENLIKIKEFLEDIYMYLNNTHNDDCESDDHKEFERQRHELKRKELIENCKHIRSIFDSEYFHPHEETKSSSYLDMNGVGCQKIKQVTSNDCTKIDASREEYVEMNHRKSENAYDIYEAAGSLLQDSESCPFTGLPAVHLKLMCSPIVGLLTRIEKKLFFAQTKDFYAGILDKWILLYPSKSNDMKPSEYFYPKSIDIPKGDNHQFVVMTNNDKRYQFQAPNSEEFYEWIVNINRIIDELTTGKLRESQIIPQQLLTRKLPSLPHVDKREDAYYTFGNTPQSINSNDERLYEEPCSSSVKDEIDNSMTPHGDEEKPPELPIKTGKKNISESEIHSYDTPKSHKSVAECEEKENENIKETTEGSNKSEEAATTPQRSVKVSEMTAILSSINLVSPEEKRKSSNLLRERKSLENSVKDEENIITAKKNSKSPVKKWFSRRIMRGKKQQNDREIMCVEEAIREDEGEHQDEEEVMASVKGTKVNMIINQLEKSGQLKALKKGLKTRKSHVYDSNDDNKEYEPICVKN